MSWSLAQAICRVGIPNYEIGMAAAHQHLVRVEDGEGTTHFTWDEAELNKLTIRTLEALLLRLRDAAKENLQ